MEKPGPRPAPAALIIEDPKLQSTGKKVLYGSLTLLFWAVWIYLWLPLVTLAGWYFGVRRFVDVMIVEQGIHTLHAVIAFYVATIAIMGGLLIGWATYNRIRFRGRERRQASPVEPSSARLARALGRRESTVLQWQHQKALRVAHRGDGSIALVEPLVAQTAADATTAGEPIEGSVGGIDRLKSY